jgi:hypothetical protein
MSMRLMLQHTVRKPSLQRLGDDTWQLLLVPVRKSETGSHDPGFAFTLIVAGSTWLPRLYVKAVAIALTHGRLNRNNT